MSEQLSLLESRQAGPFAGRAADFIVAYLRENGPCSGETLTDACKAAGIIPHNDKAFGGVYMALSIRGKIRKAGFCQRRKGHATAGGTIWGAR